MKLFTIVKENSERIPSKNFQEICNGIPVWKWTIQRLASQDNPVYVNTDSNKCLQEIHDMNYVYPIKRDQTFIDWENDKSVSSSPVEAMFLQFCNKYVGSESEPVCLFHVTSPFISIETIYAADYLDKGYDSIQSVKKIQDFVFFEDEKKIIPINYDASQIQRTQDLKPIFMSLGAFFISTKGMVVKTGRRISGLVYNYPLDAIESTEIDNIDELKISRLIAKGMLE